MANVLTVNPWTLDGSSLGVILVANQIKIRHIEFAGYASALTSVLKLADRFGNTIWQTTGDNTGDVQRSGNIGWVHGLQELTHTDGVALVYIE